MIRFFDISFAFLGLILGLPILTGLTVIGLFDTGSPVFCQTRVGRHKRPFVLLKFRTMQIGTPSAGSHLVSATQVTSFGRLLRKSKLDELPQLLNVLVGEMSLVGPRPCLFNQEELIQERESRGILEARPGITGLAQIQGIDMSTPRLLAETDKKMLNGFSLAAYFRYIALTLMGRGGGDRVRG